jgi:hypothetical protein
LFTGQTHVSVISVRVDKRVKESLERAGVDIPGEVRRFLQELAWRVELKERLERLDESLSRIPPAQQGFSAKSVREDREGH